MIIVISGLPGTGKTYFSRHLAREIGASVHSTDFIRKKLDMEGAYAERDKRIVYGALLHEMVQESQENGSVVLDGTFHKQETRKRFARMAAAIKQPLVFIEMKADPSTVKSRMQTEREYSEADFSVYRKIKADFDALQQPHLALQSDKMDLEEMIDKAKAYIHEKGSG